MRSFLRVVAGCCVLGTTAAFSRSIPTRTNRQSRQRVVCSVSPTSVASLALSAFGVLNSMKLVRQGDMALVERLGKYRKTLQPGLHFILPVVDSIRSRLTSREQVFDIPPQRCITSDNAPLSADAVVYWRIVDATKATYSVVHLSDAIQNLVLTQLRSEIGKLTLDETFSAREQINSVLLKDLDVATAPWGIKISRVEVRDIIPNRDIMQAMELQMAAERTKRASIIKSEGERASTINEAQGTAESRVLAAKSEAEATRLRAEAESAKLELEAQGVARALSAVREVLDDDPEMASRFQLTREYIAAQRDLSVSSNAKVILASDPVGDLLSRAMAVTDSVKEE